MVHKSTMLIVLDIIARCLYLWDPISSVSYMLVLVYHGRSTATIAKESTPVSLPMSALYIAIPASPTDPSQLHLNAVLIPSMYVASSPRDTARIIPILRPGIPNIAAIERIDRMNVYCPKTSLLSRLAKTIPRTSDLMRPVAYAT